MTIDQDRCRSATHSLQQSHVDNIPSPFPPRQTPVAARYGLFHALPERPSLTAALGLSGGLLALLLRRPLVGRGAGRGRLREGAESYAKALASDILR